MREVQRGSFPRNELAKGLIYEVMFESAVAMAPDSHVLRADSQMVSLFFGRYEENGVKSRGFEPHKLVAVTRRSSNLHQQLVLIADSSLPLPHRVNSNLDMVVSATALLRALNITPGNSADHTSLESLRDLQVGGARGRASCAIWHTNT